MITRHMQVLVMAVTVFLGPSLTWATEVEVQALFTNAAMLKVQGKSKMLKVGQSFGGVTLLAATSRLATIELDGQRRELTVSQRITGNYEVPTERTVSIPRDSALQYQVQAAINGRAMTVLVDTGANVVAMNSGHAASLGIDFRAGTPSRVETASGIVAAWVVALQSVDVGGIRVDNVRASVVEGTHPTTILLGMTYLQHVQMKEKNGILLLSRGY
jgi:aspartyl protease family protein